jgi:curli biogenesis system outer membrane secretion channel CsgG
VQAVKDKIRERVVRKIAIMDFTPPSGNADAGRIVTDSLLAYITAHAGSDVKILARDVLGAILKEIELGQAGLYDIESAKKAGKLKGTDVFIFGSVLNFNVEKNVSEGYKSENVVVGKRTIQNMAYQMWLMSIKGKAPTKEELMQAPPATIEEEIRETVKYKVGTEKKRSTVGVSFRVIDLEQGEVVITKTIRKSQEVKGDYSEGVAFANIQYKSLEILSNSELLEKVTQDVVAELSYEVMSRFQNLQTQYFNSAEGFKKKRDYERAIEKYMDAIHLEELKNISSPLSESARIEIEELLKRIAS